MSTLTATPPATTEVRGATGPRVTFGHLLRSEWIKFWTVRSTIWTLAATVVVMVAMVTLISLVIANETDPSGSGPGDEVYVPFIAAVQMASLAVVVLGALTITGEYRTGMIRSSITAAPRRTPVLWTKAIVVTAVIFVVSLVTVAVATAVQSLIYSPKDIALDLGDPTTQRILLGNALYLSAIALFAFAIGAIVRHSAAALAVVLGLLLVIENVVNAIPWHPLEYVRPFLPASAGARITYPEELNATMNMGDGIDLTAWTGFGILVAWIAVLLVIAAVLLKRRDA